MTTTLQTNDQKIAQAAHAAITGMGPIKSETCGHIKKTAARLRNAGLGITMTFCLKKDGEKDLKPIATAIASCIKALPGIEGIATAEQLRDRYLKADMREVRLLTTYASQALEWLGRWADTYKAAQD